MGNDRDWGGWIIPLCVMVLFGGGFGGGMVYSYQQKESMVQVVGALSAEEVSISREGVKHFSGIPRGAFILLRAGPVWLVDAVSGNYIMTVYACVGCSIVMHSYLGESDPRWIATVHSVVYPKDPRYASLAEKFVSGKPWK